MAKKKKLSQNYMDKIFVHNPELHWEKDDNNIVTIDIVNKGPHHKIAQKLFHKPRVSHISLDKYGSALWLAIDGQNTVYDVVQHMELTFPKEQSRMLDRVITFMHTLQINNFIR